MLYNIFAQSFCIRVNAFAAISLYSFIIGNAKTRPILASQHVFKITLLLLKMLLGEEKSDYRAEHFRGS